MVPKLFFVAVRDQLMHILPILFISLIYRLYFQVLQPFQVGLPFKSSTINKWHILICQQR